MNPASQLYNGDCLEVMQSLPDGSVDMVKQKRRYRTEPLSPSEVIRLYRGERWTLRMIAEHFDSNHHVIRRIMNANNVPISGNRIKKPISEETRLRQSIAAKKRCADEKANGKTQQYKYTEEQNRANQQRKLRTKIDLSRYEDFDKLKFLTKIMSRYKKDHGTTDAQRTAFLDRFYNDEQFNALYGYWIKSGKNKWWMPSIDHKIPRSQGGTNALYNLHFLSWFENKAKADMDMHEWGSFKRDSNTSSNFFIENVLDEYRRQHRAINSGLTLLGRCA